MTAPSLKWDFESMMTKLVVQVDQICLLLLLTMICDCNLLSWVKVLISCHRISYKWDGVGQFGGAVVVVVAYSLTTNSKIKVKG